MRQLNPYWCNPILVSGNGCHPIAKAIFRKRAITRGGKYQCTLFSNGQATKKTRFFTVKERCEENGSLVRSYLISKNLADTLSMKNKKTLKRWEFSRKPLAKAA